MNWIDLVPGLNVDTRIEQVLTVIDLKFLNRYERVYNFGVQDWHTYYVGDAGVLVHNQDKADCNKGNRRKNRISDKGEPGTVAENPSGTTRKKYGENGSTEKEFNKGRGPDAPKNEQNDHIHDYKPNPYNPSGRGERQPGRPPRPSDLNDMGLL
jgi:hypothetical protein